MGDDGNAMLLPQTTIAWKPDYETGDETDTNKVNTHNGDKGSYIAVLLQITNKDRSLVLYPFTDQVGNGETPKFAWAAVPVAFTWEKGKKYIYTLDFSNGAGYVDPKDPDTPDKPILSPITFKVTVEDWGPDNGKYDNGEPKEPGVFEGIDVGSK